MYKKLTFNEDWIKIPLDFYEYWRDETVDIDKNKVTYFLETLKTTSDWKLKVAIIYFFSYINEQYLVNNLIDCLSDENKFVRFSTIHTLYKLSFEKFNSILTDAIYDDFELNRIMCVQNLYKDLQLTFDEINQIRIKFRECKNYSSIKLNKEQIEILNKYNIKSLWHITHINNLFNILKDGIKCRNQINNFQNIAAVDVLDRRPEWSKDYAPLFFASNTPMLYVVSEKYGCENLVVLEIDPSVLFLDGTIFSDGNIASSDTKIFKNVCDLDKLNWNLIYSDKPAFSRDWKRIRSAEVLVNRFVLPCYINKIHFFVVYNALRVYKEFWSIFVNTITDEYGLNIKCVFDLSEEGISN